LAQAPLTGTRLQRIEAANTEVDSDATAAADAKAPAAEVESNPSGESELGVRQERVTRMMQELDDQLRALSETLAKTQPQQAERLRRAYEKSRENLLYGRMMEIEKLLNASRLESASKEQKGIINDLQSLIDTLIKEEDLESINEERDRLKEWKEQIEKLLAEEKEMLDDSNELTDEEKEMADLQEKIDALKGLIADQEGVIGKTEKASQGDADAAKLAQLGSEQAKTREETEDLAGELASGKSGEPKEGSESGKPGEKGEGKPGEESGKPELAERPMRPGEQGSKPGESGSPQEGSQSQSGQPGSQAQKKASESLQKAAGSQKKAEEQLAEGKGDQAADSEKNALADMKQALDELEERQEQLAQNASEENMGQMAEKQSDAGQKAGQMAGQMGESGQSGESGSQNSSPQQQQAQQSMQKAQQSMDQASNDLKDQKAGEASEDQEKAVDELEKALGKLDERIKELEDQLLPERLAKLLDLLQSMHSQQQLVTKLTREFDEQRPPEGQPLKRSQRLAVGKLSMEEDKIVALAKTAEKLLFDDGTSVVFKEIVSQLRGDLEAITNLLGDAQTGTFVQGLEVEAEETMAELIDALKRTQEQMEKDPGSPPPGGT
jgi:hypothetical protein